MKLYLVINKSNIFASFKDQYLLFLDKDSAMDYAIKNGYDNPFGFNDNIGVMNVYKAGEIDISIIPLETQNKHEN